MGERLNVAFRLAGLVVEPRGFFPCDECLLQRPLLSRRETALHELIGRRPAFRSECNRTGEQKNETEAECLWNWGGSP